MSSLGIVPAGGNATRFNGLAKELLPVSKDDCALSRCVKALPVAEVEVFTTADKYNAHRDALQGITKAYFTVKKFPTLADVLDYAITHSEASWYYFAMPDTVFPTTAFPKPSGPVMCGVFNTDQPERFGVFRGDEIVDKKKGKAGLAWGAWIWSREAALDLASACAQTHDYTAALNIMLQRWGVDTFPLRFYYDFASFEDYKKFLKEN